MCLCAWMCLCLHWLKTCVSILLEVSMAQCMVYLTSCHSEGFTVHISVQNSQLQAFYTTCACSAGVKTFFFSSSLLFVLFFPFRSLQAGGPQINQFSKKNKKKKRILNSKPSKLKAQGIRWEFLTLICSEPRFLVNIVNRIFCNIWPSFGRKSEAVLSFSLPYSVFLSY